MMAFAGPEAAVGDTERADGQTALDLRREGGAVALAERHAVELETRYKMLAVELLHNDIAWSTFTARCEVIAGTKMYGYTDANAVAVAGLKAFAMGWDLLAGLERIKVIYGRPCIRGEAAVGYIRSRGFHFECVENTAKLAKWKCSRPGYTTKTFEYTRDKAEVAGLPKKNELWGRFPEEMVKWACATMAAKEYFADILGGFQLAESAPDYIDIGEGGVFGPGSGDASSSSGSVSAPASAAADASVQIDYEREMKKLLGRMVDRRLQAKQIDAVQGEKAYNEEKAAVWKEATNDLPQPQGPPTQEDFSKIAKRLAAMLAQISDDAVRGR